MNNEASVYIRKVIDYLNENYRDTFRQEKDCYIFTVCFINIVLHYGNERFQCYLLIKQNQSNTILVEFDDDTVDKLRLVIGALFDEQQRRYKRNDRFFNKLKKQIKTKFYSIKHENICHTILIKHIETMDWILDKEYKNDRVIYYKKDCFIHIPINPRYSDYNIGIHRAMKDISEIEEMTVKNLIENIKLYR